jgi:ribonuclease P protein component
LNVGSDSRPPASSRLSCPARLRVRRKSEFDAIYRRGNRFSDSLFTVTYLPNTLGHPRLGLAIAARAAGDAVDRNRIRRVIRESFRLAQTALPAVDLVIGARGGIRGADNARLRSSLDGLWVRVQQSCAKSSRA